MMIASRVGAMAACLPGNIVSSRTRSGSTSSYYTIMVPDYYGAGSQAASHKRRMVRPVPAEAEDPERQLEFLLAEVSRLLMRTYNSQFRRTGLTQSQVAALVSASRVEGLNQTEIARRLGMGKAAAGKLIEDLEGRGYLRRERDPSDGRAFLLSITDTGRSRVAEIDDIARAMGKVLRDGLSREDRHHFMGVLAQMRANLDVIVAQSRRGRPTR